MIQLRTWWFWAEQGEWRYSAVHSPKRIEAAPFWGDSLQTLPAKMDILKQHLEI